MYTVCSTNKSTVTVESQGPTGKHGINAEAGKALICSNRRLTMGSSMSHQWILHP